ncbi:exodeoxyribonuclease III [Candidatus Beckwithbacteria bacterium]|nr:exodeoxyribonuclease III [Candidatus Beckwithbacteria bacterium]
MSKLTLISWNVNGIRAIARKGFAPWLEKVQPDILCLQETKANPNQLDKSLKNIPNYHSYFSSAAKAGYSGVATYTKIKPKQASFGLKYDGIDEEGRVALTEYDDFLLFNVYFPNGKASKERLAYKMKFYDEFLETVSKLTKQGKNVIFCGDVNTAHKPIDLARPKENETISGFLPEERAWLDKVIASGFIDTFRVFNQKPDQYSWWSQRTRARQRNVGWRIDYFFVNSVFAPKVTNAFIMPEVMGSDHCPIGIEIQL